MIGQPGNAMPLPWHCIWMSGREIAQSAASLGPAQDPRVAWLTKGHGGAMPWLRMQSRFEQGNEGSQAASLRLSAAAPGNHF